MRLAILTPLLTGTVHIEHAEAVSDLRLMCARRGIAFNRFFNKGSSVLPRNRNVLTAAALASGADWLLWVDGDIGFDANDVFRMMEYDLDLVGAAPQRRTKRWGEAGAVAVDLGDGQPVMSANGLVRARGLATAFLLSKAEVYRKVDAEPYASRDIGPSVKDSLRKWFWYEIDADGFDVGEDYYFCRRAADAGFEAWCDPSVRLRHFEGMVEHNLSLGDVMEAACQPTAP